MVILTTAQKKLVFDMPYVNVVKGGALRTARSLHRKGILRVKDDAYAFKTGWYKIKLTDKGKKLKRVM